MKTRIKDFLKKSPYISDFIGGVYHFFLILRLLSFRIFSLPLLLVPLKQRVVISNFEGKGFYDNPKYLVLELLKLDSNIEIIWLLNNLEDITQFPENGVQVKSNNFFNKLWYLSTSKVWVESSRKTLIPIKRKKQVYVQFWHGGLGLKKVESDIKNAKFIHKIHAYYDNRATSYMISNSAHLTKVFKVAFKYEGEIKEIGYPKNDVLFANKCELSTQGEDMISVLYVPTFRGTEIYKSEISYMPDFEKIIKNLGEGFGKKIKLIVRVHPSVVDKVNIIFDECIIDGNLYEDINEILPLCDFVISDYSSTVFDALIVKIPAVLYVSDYSDYKIDRGLYYELEELPFPSSYDTEHLCMTILNFDMDKYIEERNSFLHLVGLCDDGHSGTRVAKIIYNDLLS